MVRGAAGGRIGRSGRARSATARPTGQVMERRVEAGARAVERASDGVCLDTLAPMPEISRFLGIVIAMYYRDHAPAHFHAIYGDFEATIDIATGAVNGNLPRRALAHVQEWRELHRQELIDGWNLARSSKPLPRIAPLE